MKKFFTKKMATMLLIFGMAMNAVSCGAQNVPEGIWTGQDSEGDAFSVIFIGNQVFLPERDSHAGFDDFDHYIPATAGTVTFEKNAGTCRFVDRDDGQVTVVPFTVNSASMSFGSVSENGGSVPLAKNTGKFSVPADIGGVWAIPEWDAGYVFVNDIVYAYETGDSVMCEYTYSKGSGSINVDGRNLNFTVSGNTLTAKWMGSNDAMIFTRNP
jgi:hypothetical protein